MTFVPTPLGNLRDITLRALDVLRECDLLVAEDTRVARRLLSALELPGKPIWSYREQNAAGATPGIIERAKTERVAVISDAGMPGISDPGRALIVAARTADIAIDVLPGPSAFVCGIVLSGLDSSRFSFEGFVPRTTVARERALRASIESGRTSVWYDSPNRIIETIKALASIAPDISTFVGRELTKRFEQQISGVPGDILAALTRPVRGEIVLVLGAYKTDSRTYSVRDIVEAIDIELRAGMTPAATAKALAQRGLGDRAMLYRLASERRIAIPIR